MNGTGGTSVRSYLLAGVLRFVQATSRVRGVRRIALIGSLTTDKASPRDADVLVTIERTTDLAQLATFGRKLAGHAQQRNLGGDIFLCSTEYAYLGRTCHWKTCAPGIRAACDALHCGRQPFLHDDLQTITLPSSLLVAPPLVLWPKIETRSAVPTDVERELLAWLRQSGAV